MSRETKTLQFKVKATGITTDEEGQRVGHIEAYGAAFNNVDEGNDRIIPGAFTRTIQNSKARAKARDKKYALKMLWQHDTNEIIGGWYDLAEDGEGLSAKGDIALKTQRGAEFYELANLEMIDEFSIIYEVMPGGAKYDKSGVRDLTELRLFSIDPVTFPMNDDPHIIKIKSRDMQYKSVCGDTSLPIGPRDESWDGSKAKKQIFDYASNSDGTINASKAKKCFLQQDGDGTLKGSWHYPFCYIENGSPRISVGGVKACHGALSGSRGASTSGGDVDGMLKKVATMYNRINKKYPDDPQLSVDGDKGNHMNRQLKTLLEHYNEEMAEDLCEDWQDVFVCSLTCAIWDAFTIGDQPASDVSEALDAFKELVMSKFVPQAIECDLSGYLEESGYNYSYNSAENTMHNGSSDGYGYMSRVNRMLHKAGKPISAANQDNIDNHVANVHDLANQASKSMKASMKAIHDAADSFASKMAGNQADSDDPDDTPIEKSYHDALRELKALRA